METVIDGVTYVSKSRTGCRGCVAEDNAFLCNRLPACVESIWLKKDEVRQQVEVNKAFGHQMPLFPEIEPPVTSEEDEAWQAQQRAVARGVTDGSKNREQAVAPNVSAASVLEIAAELIGDRAASRDVEKERSMARCVRTFNAMTGHSLTEEDGWLFMQYLKQARSKGGAFRFDDYLDDVAYAALRAECAAQGKLA